MGFRYAPSTCRCPATVTFNGCPNGSSYYPVAGAVFSYTLLGVTYGPYTANASGQYTLNLCYGGSADFTITPPSGSGYAPLTQTITLATNVSIYSFQLSLASGYQCNFCGCGGNDSTSAPGPPYLTSQVDWPSTLYLNDGFGAVTMSGGGSSFSWTGCGSRTAAYALIYDSTLGAFQIAANQTVAVVWSIQCNYFNPVTGALGISVSCMFPVGQYPSSPPSCASGAYCTTGAGGTPYPYAASYTGCPGLDWTCGFISTNFSPPAGATIWFPLQPCPPSTIAMSGSMGPFVSQGTCASGTAGDNVPYQVYSSSSATAVSVTQ